MERRSEQARVGVLFFGQYPPRGFKDHPDGRYLLPGDPMPKARAAVTAAAPAPADPEVSVAPADPDRLPGMPAPPVPGNPAPEFQPSAGPAVERRRAQRVDVFVNFVLQLTDAQGVVLKEELTVADNIGRGGVRVMSTLPFQVGDVVLLQEAGGAFTTRAEVRGVSQVQSAFVRLHLRFIDRQAPDRLLH